MRNATEVCPQCFKKFKMTIWLQKHISKEHPEYKKEIDLKRRRDCAEDDRRPSKHRVQPSYAVFPNHDPDPVQSDCNAIDDAPLDVFRWWPKAPSTDLADSWPLSTKYPPELKPTRIRSLLHYRNCYGQNFLITLFSHFFRCSLMRACFSGSSCGGGRKLPVQA